MKRILEVNGVSLAEMAIAVALSVVVMAFLWKGMLFLQSTLAEQVRLDRMSQVLLLTQDISKNVREAVRIASVGPDQLDLEVYNHAAYDVLDPRLYENLKRVRYQVRSDGKSASLVREVYSSTGSVTPEATTAFLKNADLMVPTEKKPFFFASYLVGTSTVGVRIALGLHPPYSQAEWVPVKDEVYVKAE